MNCELCGKPGSLVECEVEGTEMQVCAACSAFGKLKKNPSKASSAKTEFVVLRKKPILPQEPQKIEILIHDFARVMKQKRERMGLMQKEFAHLLQEKDTLIHKIETGNYRPGIASARKFEKILGIKLIDEYEEPKHSVPPPGDSNVTIGDIIRVRRRN